LQRNLLPYHDVIPVYLGLLSVLLGKQTVPNDISFDLASLLAVFKPSDLNNKTAMSSGALNVLVRLLRSSTDVIGKDSRSQKNETRKYLARITFTGMYFIFC
jgi:hypothetical protein